MVQIIRRTPQVSAHDLVGESASNAVRSFADYFSSKEKKKQLHDENEYIKQNFKVDLTGVVDPEERKIILGQMLKQGAPAAKETPLQAAQRQKYEQQTKSLQASQRRIGQLLGEYDPNEEMQMGGENPQGQPQMGQEPPQQGQQGRKKIEDYSDEELGHLAAYKNDPNPDNKYIANVAEQEQNRRKEKEKIERETTKGNEKKAAELRKEILPYINEISTKADLARNGIENKENLLDLIENGDIDDPTYAALAQALPLNLGKRLLSNDTVEYKAGLIEEFGDLRKLFQGQTRVKEIELLEEKIPDLYLTNDQKKAIIKSRINALRSDILREEAASEIEEMGKPMSLLKFKEKVNAKFNEKMKALANTVIDEQKSIIQNAENKKKLPLTYSDPDDKEIIDQILKESGGNVKKAEELAKKKGYTW